MTGEPVKLHFKEKDDLDCDVRLGIIEPVPQATTWAMVRKNGRDPKEEQQSTTYH